MSKIEEEIHAVEFWPAAFKDVGEKEVHQTTLCKTPQEAIDLEEKFHAIGWPARAVTLQTRMERIHLTSRVL